MALSPEEELELLELEEAEAQGLASAPQPQEAPSPTPQDRPFQAALEGFGDTATMGYLPHLQALASKPLYGALNALTGQSVEPMDYVQERDMNIARQKGLSESNPGSSLAGKGLGIAATTMLPAGKLAAFLAPKSVAGAAALGATQGAIYNPGDKQGEVDPLQLEERAGNAAVGGLAGGALGTASKGIGYLKNRGQMVDRIKDSSGLSQSVKGEVDDALASIQQNQIAPRAAKLKEFLSGKQIDLNPEAIQSSMPHLAQKMLEKQGPKASLDANRALRLRRALDAKAKYKAGALYDPASQASQASAKQGADLIRGKLSDLGPEVGQLNSEMADMIKASSTLRKSSNKAPILSITSPLGVDKASLISKIDDLAGSNLKQTASGISQAKNDLLNPINLVKPLEAPNELRKLGMRGAMLGAKGIDKATPEATKAMLLQSLFEGLRNE